MAVFELSQRELESVLENLDPVYRLIEDCEDSDDLRGYAQTLYRAAYDLQQLAAEYDAQADWADEDEADWADEDEDGENGLDRLEDGE